jgi:hypothetical protein
MKIKFTFLALLLHMAIFSVNAQDEDSPGLTISGSVDTYYKYDFSGQSQIGTSFAGAQNTIGIGMVDLAFSQTWGKASFVGEIAFGPRADASAPGPVQNLYISYAFNDMISVTGGFMGTFIGYEVISPAANFNYSTSYLFSNGPFQNGGVRFDFTFSEKVAFMLGVFNNFDSYTNDNNGMDLGAQLYLMPVQGWDLYLNFVTSDDSGTELDITTTYQVSDKLLIGLNAAKRTRGNFFIEDEGEGINFSGVATYLNYSISDPVAVGLRYEYFYDNNGVILGTDSQSTSVNAVTLSANIHAGPITLIPEYRIDMASMDIFGNSSGNPTPNASQIVIAAVYVF